MTVYKYKIEATNKLSKDNPANVHAVLTNLFGKTENLMNDKKIEHGIGCLFMYSDNKYGNCKTEFSFVRNGRKIDVKASCTFLGEVEMQEYQDGDRVKVRGEISYSIHDTKTKKNVRVVQLNCKKSNYINGPRGEEALKTFIKTRLGVEPEQILVEPLRTVFCCNNKTVHDAFTFQVIGFVSNVEQIARLAHSSVGRARSYGFGSLSVSVE